MSTLPIFTTDDKDMSLMQTGWAKEINPLLRNSFLQGILLPSVQLSAGANIVNHRLGRKLQGWVLTRARAASVIYDTQDNNAYPDLTLLLQSSSAVTVDLYVF